MINAEYRNIYIKTLYVVISCKTITQIKVASKYLTLAGRKFSQRHKDMLMNQALITEVHINESN